MRIFHEHYFAPFLAIALVALWSGVSPYETLTWWLEAAPILLLFAAAVATRRHFVWTPLSYWLFALGCVLVLVGAHYTYARMPVFEWLKVEFGWERNHYDRFGHFFQGVVPAIIFRELLLRTSSIGRGVWLRIVVIALCVSKSVLYEFAEWWSVLVLNENAHEFLAMQGDEWDAQKDMLLAAFGSVTGLFLFSCLHDRQLARQSEHD